MNKFRYFEHSKFYLGLCAWILNELARKWEFVFHPTRGSRSLLSGFLICFSRARIIFDMVFYIWYFIFHLTISSYLQVGVLLMRSYVAYKRYIAPEMLHWPVYCTIWPTLMNIILPLFFYRGNLCTWWLLFMFWFSNFFRVAVHSQVQAQAI